MSDYEIYDDDFDTQMFHEELNRREHEIEKIRKNGLYLKYFCAEDQNERICRMAVNQNGLALQYVKIPQERNICMSAIFQNGLAIQFVKIEKDRNLCLEAVKRNGLALQYVLDQDLNICIYAVKQNGLALQYVANQDQDICTYAVKQNGLALQYVLNQDRDICIEAVKQNGLALQYVLNQDICLCSAAVKQNIEAINFVKVDINPEGDIYERIKEVKVYNHKSKDFKYYKNSIHVVLRYLGDVVIKEKELYYKAYSLEKELLFTIFKN